MAVAAAGLLVLVLSPALLWPGQYRRPRRALLPAVADAAHLRDRRQARPGLRRPRPAAHADGPPDAGPPRRRPDSPAPSSRSRPTARRRAPPCRNGATGTASLPTARPSPPSPTSATASRPSRRLQPGLPHRDDPTGGPGGRQPRDHDQAAALRRGHRRFGHRRRPGGRDRAPERHGPLRLQVHAGPPWPPILDWTTPEGTVRRTARRHRPDDHRLNSAPTHDRHGDAARRRSGKYRLRLVAEHGIETAFPDTASPSSRTSRRR